MTEISDWSNVDANNSGAAPAGWPTGMAPSDVKNTGRQMMGSIRRWYEDAQWLNFGFGITRLSATTFEVSAATSTAINWFTPDRRIRAKDGANTYYGSIVSATISAAKTNVTVSLDSGSLTSSLSIVDVGIINPAVDSTPNKNIIQIVDSSSTTYAQITGVIPIDDTIPQSSEGTSVVAVAITPRSASNILIIDWGVDVIATSNALGTTVAFPIFVSSSADAIAVGAKVISTSTNSVSFTHKRTAGATTALTFTFRAGTAAGSTVGINGSSAARLFGGASESYIRITEIEP